MVWVHQHDRAPLDPMPSPISPPFPTLPRPRGVKSCGRMAGGALRLLVMRLAVRVGALAAAGGQWCTTLALVLWLVVHLGSSSPY